MTVNPPDSRGAVRAVVPPHICDRRFYQILSSAYGDDWGGQMPIKNAGSTGWFPEIERKSLTNLDRLCRRIFVFVTFQPIWCT